MKVKFKHLIGLSHPIPILEWKWEVISMDFITCLPKTSRNRDAIMMVIENLSKVANFLAVKSTNSASEVFQFFIKKIMRLHGIPRKIISDRDANFILIFWKKLFVGLVIELAFCTTYHTQREKNGTNRILEDMWRIYVMHRPKKWEEYLPLSEFAYNNGYQ